MIELKISGENTEQFAFHAAGMVDLLQRGLGGAPIGERVIESAKRARAKKAEPEVVEVKAEEVVPVEEVLVAQPEAEIVEAQAEPEPAKEITENELQKLIIDAVKAAVGDDQAQKAQAVRDTVFAPLGLKGLKSTPAERYPDLHAALEAFIAAQEG